MRIPCPTCHRRGTVNIIHDGPMGYVGPRGERWPQETCQTCAGSGWVESPVPIKRDDEIAVESAADLIERAKTQSSGGHGQ